jgi:H+/Cl- antiporter ClcA
MVTLSGFVDPVASLLHPENAYPVFGVAVSCTTVFESYNVRLGFFETVPFVDVSVIEYCLIVKFAVMFLFFAIVILSGFVDPDVSPLQPVKV